MCFQRVFDNIIGPVTKLGLWLIGKVEEVGGGWVNGGLRVGGRWVGGIVIGLFSYFFYYHSHSI